MPLVDPPIACITTWALRKEDAVRISLGRGPPEIAISAARLRPASARRMPPACGGVMVAPIGKDRPIASVLQAMVLAVPNTIQVPTEGATIKTSAWDPSYSLLAELGWPGRTSL